MRLPIATILLVAVNAGLLAAIGMQFVREPQTTDLSIPRVSQLPEVRLQLDVPNSTTNLDPIQSQAVFYKSRSFHVPPPSTALELPAPDYRLTGSMSLPNRPLSALLLHNQSNARVKVSVGDELDGWMVSAIDQKCVTVQLGARSAQIRSATASGSPGITAVSGTHPAISTSPSAGILRVPAGAGGARPFAPAPAARASSEARLYRPPGG